MTFEVSILGSNSAIPAHGRLPTAQVVKINERLYLVDAGEGTQIQMKKERVKFSKINNIFISHLHGDHFYGLIGIISTFHLLKRQQPLNIYGPAGLDEIINIQLKYSQTTLNFELNFHEINSAEPQVIYENEDMLVETILMTHRIPCTGFLFREKRTKRKIIEENIHKFKIPYHFMNELKKGKDYVNQDGETIKNEDLTIVNAAPRSYAFCTDTAYNEDIISQINNVDLLYHEATFGEESTERAKETYHSTTVQAATLAIKGNVKKLLIGHFSAKYKDLQPLLEEARSIFKNTELALEGTRFEIPLLSIGS